MRSTASADRCRRGSTTTTRPSRGSRSINIPPPGETRFVPDEVLVEFDSVQEAIACHDTPDYTEALKALGTGNVERDMRIVEGG